MRFIHPKPMISSVYTSSTSLRLATTKSSNSGIWSEAIGTGVVVQRPRDIGIARWRPSQSHSQFLGRLWRGTIAASRSDCVPWSLGPLSRHISVHAAGKQSNPHPLPIFALIFRLGVSNTMRLRPSSFEISRLELFVDENEHTIIAQSPLWHRTLVPRRPHSPSTLAWTGNVL